jgi:hypothetical protein
MILVSSRYVDAQVVFTPDSRSGVNKRRVIRTWPNINKSYFTYYWVDGDRPDSVAVKYLGDPDAWWSIMDMNPEILHPLHIPVGAPIRIPHG